MNFISAECIDDLNEAECEEVVNNCLHECGRCEIEDGIQIQTIVNSSEPTITGTQPLNYTVSHGTGKQHHYIKSVLP